MGHPFVGVFGFEYDALGEQPGDAGHVVGVVAVVEVQGLHR
jgi:hypothetical protein